MISLRLLLNTYPVRGQVVFNKQNIISNTVVHNSESKLNLMLVYIDLFAILQPMTSVHFAVYVTMCLTNNLLYFKHSSAQ